MIHVRSSPNNAGVEVLGDFMDFDGLYDSLHAVMGDEGEFGTYSGGRLRVMGVCYDLRHALMGDRDFEFVENCIDSAMLKRAGVVAPGKNVYYKIDVLWPEILFVIMALNDFLMLYARTQSKTRSFNALLDKRVVWDAHVARARMFQAAVTGCIKETVSEPTFARMMNHMNKDWPWMGGYIAQYVDVLNVRFLHMDKDKRRNNISMMAKRLYEQGEEYQLLKEEIQETAKKHNCALMDVQLDVDYPENIDW